MSHPPDDSNRATYLPGRCGTPVRLVALDRGGDIPVGRSPVVVGRHAGCDTRLESIRVSRQHCCLVEDCGEVVVRDLGSTNGTWVNGLRVTAGRLRPGDELWVAHYRFRFEYAREASAHFAPTLDGSGFSSPAAVAP